MAKFIIYEERHDIYCCTIEAVVHVNDEQTGEGDE